MPKFLIIGPPDHNQLTQFWSSEQGDWVDRDSATLYTGREVFSFPPWELPVGSGGILDIEDGVHYTPRSSGKTHKDF